MVEWWTMMTPSWLEHLQSRCKWAKAGMVEWWTTMTTPLRQVLLVLVLVLVVEIPVCCRGRLGMPGWACLAGHAWLGMPCRLGWPSRPACGLAV